MELNAAIATGVSLVLVLVLFVSAYTNRREHAKFMELTETRDRRRTFRTWVIQSFIFFSGITVIALAIFGRLPALTAMPAEFAPLSERITGTLDAVYIYLILAVILAIVIVSQTLSFKSSQSGTASAGNNPALAMLPRNTGEMVWTGLVSLNAGLGEELFFRLLLPLLLVHALGSPEAAFAAATLVFGFLHYNQGLVGIVATALGGAMFAALYLVSGNIWLAVLVHAGMDLHTLVILPLFGFAAARRRARAASPDGGPVG